MKTIILLISITFSISIMASTEKELLDLMVKDFDEKEILVNRSLCAQFNSLYDKMTETEQKNISRKDCPRIEAKIDENKKADEYFSQLNKQINIIAETKTEIRDRKSVV